MNPNAAQIRQLRRNNLRHPIALASVPPADWPLDVRLEGAGRVAVMRSRAFLVQVFEEPGEIIRLSVQRTEWDERQKRFREHIAWDELQRLKAEAGFGDRWAVEIYPADAAIVNVANMRHLWLLQDAPAYAWLDRAMREARAA